MGSSSALVASFVRLRRSVLDIGVTSIVWIGLSVGGMSGGGGIIPISAYGISAWRILWSVSSPAVLRVYILACLGGGLHRMSSSRLVECIPLCFRHVPLRGCCSGIGCSLVLDTNSWWFLSSLVVCWFALSSGYSVALKSPMTRKALSGFSCLVFWMYVYICCRMKMSPGSWAGQYVLMVSMGVDLGRLMVVWVRYPCR